MLHHGHVIHLITLTIHFYSSFCMSIQVMSWFWACLSFFVILCSSCKAFYQEFVTIIQLIGENVGNPTLFVKKTKNKTIEHIWSWIKHQIEPPKLVHWFHFRMKPRMNERYIRMGRFLLDSRTWFPKFEAQTFICILHTWISSYM